MQNKKDIQKRYIDKKKRQRFEQANNPEYILAMQRMFDEIDSKIMAA